MIYVSTEPLSRALDWAIIHIGPPVLFTVGVCAFWYGVALLMKGGRR